MEVTLTQLWPNSIGRGGGLYLSLEKLGEMEYLVHSRPLFAKTEVPDRIGDEETSKIDDV